MEDLAFVLVEDVFALEVVVPVLLLPVLLDDFEATELLEVLLLEVVALVGEVVFLLVTDDFFFLSTVVWVVFVVVLVFSCAPIAEHKQNTNSNGKIILKFFIGLNFISMIR